MAKSQKKAPATRVQNEGRGQSNRHGSAGFALRPAKPDSTAIRIPIDFTYAGIVAAPRSMMNSGSVPYTVDGDVTVGTPGGNFTVRYTGSGRFRVWWSADHPEVAQLSSSELDV